MALQLRNPGGLYQGEAPLNPLPYVNIALQQRARRQAREDAIDKYYRELPNTINDKGVRDQEIPLINEYRNKIFEYGLKNKEALRNPKLDNGAAQFNLNKLMQEAQGVARQSQELGRRSLERGKMYLSKEGRWAVDDEDFMTAEELESLPINDPRHKQMDMPALLSNRPFDEREFGKEIQGKIKYGTKTQTTNDPDNPLYDIVSQVPTLDESAKGKIYAFGAEKLHGNRRFADFINKKTPEQLQVLGQIFKDNYGKDPTDDEDIAAAYIISQLPITSTKQKRQIDTEAVMAKKREEGMADWKAKERIRQANRRELFNMRIAADKANDEVDDLWYDRYLNQVSDESKRPENRQEYKLASGGKVGGYKVQLDPVLSKAVGIDAKNPGQLLVTDNGDYILSFYDTDANYNPIIKGGQYVIDPSRRTTITKDALKLALGGKTGVKQLNKEMNKPSKPIKITAKKGELDDL